VLDGVDPVDPVDVVLSFEQATPNDPTIIGTTVIANARRRVRPDDCARTTTCPSRLALGPAPPPKRHREAWHRSTRNGCTASTSA
jgi:hypothetical protein